MCETAIYLHLKESQSSDPYYELFRLAIKHVSLLFLTCLVKRNPPTVWFYVPNIFIYHMNNPHTIKLLSAVFHSSTNSLPEAKEQLVCVLFVSAMCQDTKMLETVCTLHFDISQTCKWDNHNVLSLTTCYGSLEIFRYLLDEKKMSHLFVHPQTRMNLLHMAVYFGNKPILQEILARELFDIDSTLQDTSTNALHLSVARPASKVNSLEIFKMLQSKIPKAKATKVYSALNGNGDTLLLLAFKAKRTKLFKHLLSIPEIDPNQENIQGETILIHAIRHKELSFVKILLSNKRVSVKHFNKSKELLFFPLFFSI